MDEADAAHCTTVKITSDNCRVCNPCPPNEMGESEDLEVEFQESEIHAREAHKSDAPQVRAYKSYDHDPNALEIHSSECNTI